MANKHKQKGKYFESKVAKLIIETYNIVDESEVHRAQASGTFSYEFGDIYFKDPLKYRLVIECKFRNNFDIRHVLLWKKPITDYWEQVIEESMKFTKKYNIEPIPILVVSKPYDLIYGITKAKCVSSDYKPCFYIVNRYDYVCMLFQDLLKCVRIHNNKQQGG